MATRTAADSTAVLSTAKIVPVLRPQRAEDRLQGCKAAATLRLRAGQNRSQPDHGGFRQKAAGACPGHQAGTISRPVAVCDTLI